MFFNVLAFIIALGEPTIGAAGAVAARAPGPLAETTQVAERISPQWVFADEPLAPLKGPGLSAGPELDLVVNLRGHRRARARMAKINAKRAPVDLRAKRAPVDLRQALLDIRGPGPVTTIGDAGPVGQSPGSARGFVRIGGGDGADILWREGDGLFYVSARINGEVVRLIVDTGASFTVLSAEDARRIGIDPGKITFAESADTAAGATPMARVVLANLEIGQNVAAGVPAMVASGPLRTSLLGQNVLSRLGSVTIEGDRMTLR